jgi:hypothetical protein
MSRVNPFFVAAAAAQRAALAAVADQDLLNVYDLSALAWAVSAIQPINALRTFCFPTKRRNRLQNVGITYSFYQEFSGNWV